MGERKGQILKNADWAKTQGKWHGAVDGTIFGTGVTVLFFESDEVGAGAKLHVHPYDEVFVIREGNARFTVGDSVIDASAGDIVFGPAEVPHKFKNLGPGRLSTVDIHHSDRWIQTNLPDPEADVVAAPIGRKNENP